MRLVSLFAACIMLQGCNSVAPPTANYRPAVRNLAFPQIDKIVEVRKGEVMLAKGYSKEVQGIQFAQSLKLDQFTLHPGFYPRIGDDANFTYYSFRTTPGGEGTGYIPPTRNILGEWLPAPNALRISKADGMTCLIFVDLMQKACNSQARYEQAAREELGSRDLVQKLIYEGRSADRITIRYWEKSGHSARPESSRELTYDLPPAEIEFGGARLRIIGADEEKVRFVAWRNFAEYWVGTRPDGPAPSLIPVSSSADH